jgi:hypothetical protein
MKFYLNRLFQKIIKLFFYGNINNLYMKLICKIL